MTEFQELIQDAPNFVSMERGELVAYAYGMFAAGTKADAENAKLRDLLQRTWDAFHDATAREFVRVKNELRELGIEVEECTTR